MGGALAEKLRQEQERRALEEKAAQLAADLTEDATSLFKSLDTLGLGERAHKKLDSAAVAAEVEELVAKSSAAIEAFPGHDGLAKVDTIIGELQVAMADFLTLEESRRKKREKEKV